MSANADCCPGCRAPSLEPATYHREFWPHGQTIRVALLTRRCLRCGALATSAGQHEQNLLRLEARKAAYGALPRGEEIQAWRRCYGLTRPQAARLIGKSVRTFARYEAEIRYPDARTTRLLRLAIDDPSACRAMAEAAGVALPLWASQDPSPEAAPC